VDEEDEEEEEVEQEEEEEVVVEERRKKVSNPSRAARPLPPLAPATISPKSAAKINFAAAAAAAQKPVGRKQ
jgi:hypothetical protein